MQPLTQHIFTQIIDFCFYLSKRFSDFSLRNLLWKSKQTFFFFENLVFDQMFTRNAKKLSGHAASQLLQFFNIQPLWEEGQESHYIQLSNLSSALIMLFSYTTCSIFL